MTKIPVIIDCDPGIDDVMALLLAFASDELDIRLITTEPGNQTQDKTIYNARALSAFMIYVLSRMSYDRTSSKAMTTMSKWKSKGV